MCLFCKKKYRPSQVENVFVFMEKLSSDKEKDNRVTERIRPRKYWIGRTFQRPYHSQKDVQNPVELLLLGNFSSLVIQKRIEK